MVASPQVPAAMAVLLELLDRHWRQWTAELPAHLDVAIHPDAPVRERAQAFAAALTRSLAPHQVLCDLLSAQAGVLEHNVSAEVAARYKRSALANVATLATLTRHHLPELGDRADGLCAQAVMVTGAVWTHARPSTSMLAASRMDFSAALEEMLATLIAGALSRAEG
ncbi:hypothetical protein [Streptomyces buecherae]|uniref:hypothetical protein n=1 Tax=Streptomyces buecherae TaxID=2763006 RepID=UPI00367CB1F5